VSVFIFKANTTSEGCTFSCHLLHVSALFGHRQLHSTTTYTEENTTVVSFFHS